MRDKSGLKAYELELEMVHGCQTVPDWTRNKDKWKFDFETTQSTAVTAPRVELLIGNIVGLLNRMD